MSNKRLASLKLQRRWFAEELRWNAKLTSERLVEAFATVPREAFLGRGPWHILSDRAFERGYVKTGDADPRHVSHNVLVAIDPVRRLNNGHPTFLASLIEQLNLKDGDTACHMGCGTGYYSAIMAEMVGKGGRLVAVEIDKTLARRARRNLAGYRQAEVIGADGFAHNPGRVDAILVNAGVTHLSRVWLEALKANGRLVVPLTLENGVGRILKVTRKRSGWHAGFVSLAGIFHCVGGRSRSAENRLKKALDGGGAEKVRSLRLDGHKRSRSCWLHGDGFCLSRALP
jgi:protein-L-isoaspartate(D-aspartate) O-methyltransferase